MNNPISNPWRCALELKPDRSVSAGSPADLCAAIGRGADLRVYTEWLYEEHITPDLPPPAIPANNGLVQEIIDMRETMLIADRYAAGITTLRQPIQPCEGFNPAMAKRTSFFMYGMDGVQSSANLILDDTPATAAPGKRQSVPRRDDMPKMSPEEVFDQGTHGPSRNFVYDFEVFRYFVRDDWSPILSHDEQGRVTDGSWDSFTAAHRAGREFKAGISGLCADLGGEPSHEVFTFLGSGWVHTGRKYYEVLTHPLVRVSPTIPAGYRSGGWDVAWVFLRTDGYACLRVLNPYTRRFTDRATRLAVRWFVR